MDAAVDLLPLVEARLAEAKAERKVAGKIARLWWADEDDRMRYWVAVGRTKALRGLRDELRVRAARVS